VACVAIVAVGAHLVFSDDGWDDQTPEEAATKFVEFMDDSEFKSVHIKMNTEMKRALSANDLEVLWTSLVVPLGDMMEIEAMTVREYGEHIITESFCTFEHGAKRIRIVLDADNKIAGLFIYENSPRNSDPVPDGLKETDIKLNEGTQWELAGKITSNGFNNKVAAVIVHGSGSSDMDLTLGMNKTYRDLAWGLAENGIDVLRYDKRTFTYATAATSSTFTINEETIDDAIAAAKLLKGEGYTKVFLIGHSLGGMMAPRIVSESEGAFDGFISMAGSPRTLAKIQADQNLNAGASSTLVEAELKKLDDMDDWSDLKLRTTTIFGISAYYHKELNKKDTETLVKSLNVPMMFIQGDQDFQVFVEKDFEMWKDIASSKSKTKFVLYEGLNHMFAESKGDNAGTTLEYYPRNDISGEVIKDISDFIKTNS